MEHKYPNLSPTAMPIASHKALHYLYNGEQRKAIELFKEGLPMNPYLYMTETFLGFAYKEVGDDENAVYYTKLAFENAPNDAIHFANYLYTIADSSDSLLVKDIYFQVPEKYRTNTHDEIYLLVTASLSDPASPDFTLDGIDIDFQAGNDRLKKGYYFNQVGVDKTLKANELYFIGMEYFELENYQEAITNFLKAAELNPFELAYLENAANAYMRIQEDQKALELLDRLVLEFNSKSPKVFYLRALLLFGFDRKEEACKDFKIAYDAGLINRQFFSNFCNY